MGWLNAIFQRVPAAALGPPGPHPNEGLRDLRPESADVRQILTAPVPPEWLKVPDGMKEAIELYGDPGANGGRPDKRWERDHLVVLRDLPGTWNNQPSGQCKLYVHKAITVPLREVLVRLERADLIHHVETLGAFCFRRIRHQKTGPLSYHSFAVAVDVNAAKNFGVVDHPKFLSRQNQPVPEPFSEGWRKIWPDGVDENVVSAFEACGAKWGGRWRGYVDPMHFQWVRSV